MSKKIAYLFGAGATHAEIMYSEALNDDNRLLLGDVSRRVFLEVQKDPDFLKGYEFLLRRTADGSNIELLISFLENNAPKIDGAHPAIAALKSGVETDIKNILTKERRKHFILHKALLEFHEHKVEEVICGLISLNYDTVLDEAYKLQYKGEPNYYRSSENKDDRNPSLLKLHGSFDWDHVNRNGNEVKIPIIPLGINKNYLQLPYSFIWGRALEVLIECDILRVIGCSLSPHDVNLVDLLFKAQLEKGAAFEIQVIGPEDIGTQIRNNYLFLSKVVTATEIPEVPMADSKTNVFQEWLKVQADTLDRSVLEQTTNLRKLIL